MGEEALRHLGVDPYQARRLALIFKKKDKDMMPELSDSRSEVASYVSSYRKQHEDLQTLMELDHQKHSDEVDVAWTAKNPET